MSIYKKVNVILYTLFNAFIIFVHIYWTFFDYGENQALIAVASFIYWILLVGGIGNAVLLVLGLIGIGVNKNDSKKSNILMALLPVVTEILMVILSYIQILTLNK